MDILITIIIGGVVGWLASIVMKTNAQMGIIANIIVGIIGAWLGFWLAPKLGFVPTGGIGVWLVAICGAILLILLLKILGVFK
jgi:uncharacterized membrane protein YeaQ/YmgE (transglycosylase-associated protein family)